MPLPWLKVHGFVTVVFPCCQTNGVIRYLRLSESPCGVQGLSRKNHAYSETRLASLQAPCQPLRRLPTV